MSEISLSVAIATFNEEQNIETCLESIKDIAGEIVVVDGSSTDKTVEIAKKYRAVVLVTENKLNFHINKQKAFDMAKGKWILYLDADEKVSPELAKEILKVIDMDQNELEKYQDNLKKKELFLRHLKVLEERDGKIGTGQGEYVAFFFPRLNFFLGRFLKYGGVYPDGVIRLFKNKKAYLPGKNVHEQMVVLGRVGWLSNDLIHYDSKTLKRYLERNNRYINLIADEFKTKKLKKNFTNFLTYMIVKPVSWFLLTTIFNKGVLDGYQGLVFSFFSALRFPRAYWRYFTKK